MPCNEASPGKRNTAARYHNESQPWLIKFRQKRDHLPCETSHERNELVKVLRASPADDRAAYDDKEPEHVLLPLDVPVQLPASSEETILHDPHGGEQLKWHGKQDRERVKELHCLREA